MSLKGAGNNGGHSAAANSQTMADWSERLGHVDDPAAKSLKGSLDARIDVAQVIPDVVLGDPEISELIRSSEGLYRGSNVHGDDALARARAMLGAQARDSFDADIQDADIGPVDFETTSATNDKSFAWCLRDTLKAGGYSIPADVDGYFPNSNMSAEDLGLDMSEVEEPLLA